MQIRDILLLAAAASTAQSVAITRRAPAPESTHGSKRDVLIPAPLDEVTKLGDEVLGDVNQLGVSAQQQQAAKRAAPSDLDASSLFAALAKDHGDKMSRDTPADLDPTSLFDAFAKNAGSGSEEDEEDETDPANWQLGHGPAANPVMPRAPGSTGKVKRFGGDGLDSDENEDQFIQAVKQILQQRSDSYAAPAPVLGKLPFDVMPTTDDLPIDKILKFLPGHKESGEESEDDGEHSDDESDDEDSEDYTAPTKTLPERRAPAPGETGANGKPTDITRREATDNTYAPASVDGTDGSSSSDKKQPASHPTFGEYPDDEGVAFHNYEPHGSRSGKRAAPAAAAAAKPDAGLPGLNVLPVDGLTDALPVGDSLALPAKRAAAVPVVGDLPVANALPVDSLTDALPVDSLAKALPVGQGLGLPLPAKRSSALPVVGDLPVANALPLDSITDMLPVDSLAKALPAGGSLPLPVKRSSALPIVGDLPVANALPLDSVTDALPPLDRLMSGLPVRRDARPAERRIIPRTDEDEESGSAFPGMDSVMAFADEVEGAAEGAAKKVPMPFSG